MSLRNDPCETKDLPVGQVTIPIPDLNLTQGFPKDGLNHLLTHESKPHIFEILKDRILTPRGYDALDFNNFFKKVEWSTSPIVIKHSSNPCSLLATLTSTFQLGIYGKTSNYSRKSTADKWEQLLNISQIYNELLQEEWVQDKRDFRTFNFQEYKDVMYEMSIINFTWMPLFGSETHESTEANLITAHANGDIVVWSLENHSGPPSPATNSFTAKVLCKKKNVWKDDCISAMNFHKVNGHMGILAIGTNDGAVLLLRITTNISEIEEHLSASLTIDDGSCIIEQDFLVIDALEWTPLNKENILKAPTLNLVIVKHPNYVFSADIVLASEEITVSKVEHVQIPEGPIVGISHYSEKQYIICHEAGVFTSIEIENGLIKYENSSSRFSDPSNLYFHSGFSFSPNKVMACVGKQLDCQYHPHSYKEPAKLVFFSTLNGPEAWTFVKKTYEANNSNFHIIPDILYAFRFNLRTHKSLTKDDFMDGRNLGEMTLEQLRLYLWVIKCLRVDGKDCNSDEKYKRQLAGLMLRRAEVENYILRYHFAALIDAIDGNKKLAKFRLDKTNLNSLFLIQKFLLSKMNSLKLPSWACSATVQKAAPSCPFCSSAIDFDSEKSSLLFGESSSNEKGYSWDYLHCTENKHSFPVCVLTLLPCTIPYRACQFCNVVASFQPAFGQDPICPFCETEMPVAGHIQI